MMRHAGHHPCCGGFRTAHDHEIRGIPTPGPRRMRQIVCVECGNTSPMAGPDMDDTALERLVLCETSRVPCDGRCLSGRDA